MATGRIPSPIYESVALSAKRRNKLIAFGWYGGKFSHLNWLLPLLPKCHHYCEPFAGSAAVLLNRDVSPVETYNDIDGEVANFFRVLRDHRNELVEAIGLTPFSRQEFSLAVSKTSDSIPDIEKARRFFVRARQARTGLAQTASLGRWANAYKLRTGQQLRLLSFTMPQRPSSIAILHMFIQPVATAKPTPLK